MGTFLGSEFRLGIDLLDRGNNDTIPAAGTFQRLCLINNSKKAYALPVLSVILLAAVTSGNYQTITFCTFLSTRFLSIIFAVSLRLVLVNGLLSFGHGAFIGVGCVRFGPS